MINYSNCCSPSRPCEWHAHANAEQKREEKEKDDLEKAIEISNDPEEMLKMWQKNRIDLWEVLAATVWVFDLWRSYLYANTEQGTPTNTK